MEKILVIDDQVRTFSAGLEESLDGYELLFAENGRAGLELLRRNAVAVVLLDVRMPAGLGTDSEREGLAVLRAIKQEFPRLPVVMLTVTSDIETIVEAIKLGAFHYVLKPPDREQLVVLIEQAAQVTQMRNDLRHLKQVVRIRDSVDASVVGAPGRDSFGALVGGSAAMNSLYTQIEKVAAINAPVLLRGPTGSGKELVARELHRCSARSGAFVAINCSAIPEHLLESELFGYEAGAFTDAQTAKPGLIVGAHRGTVLLDEIADMPVPLQAKLLRVVQDKQVPALGASRPYAVDVRWISATNRDLEQLVRSGRFREDLYYRLNVIGLAVPPLAERRQDIPLLTDYFIRTYAAEFKKEVRSLAPALRDAFDHYSWPGNVRELEATIQRLVALCEGPEIPEDAWSAPPPASGADAVDDVWQQVCTGTVKIEDMTLFRNTHGSVALERLICRAIEQTRDVREAGRLLGYIPADDAGEKYANFRQWLRRLGISKRSVLYDE